MSHWSEDTLGDVTFEVSHDWDPRSGSLETNKMLFGSEGGAVYTIDDDAGYIVYTDESSMAEFLDDDDRIGLNFQTARRFKTKPEREQYLELRGWPPNLGPGWRHPAY